VGEQVIVRHLLWVGTLCAAAGCSSPAHRRVARDLTVAAATPVQVPWGAVATTNAAGHHPALYPFFLVHNTVKHAAYSVVHLADVLYYPAALCTGAGPLELYDTQCVPYTIRPGQPSDVADMSLCVVYFAVLTFTPHPLSVAALL
jgi:hypothetical protein